MANLLRQGAAFRNQIRHAHMTDLVSYVRGESDPISINATVGRTEFDQADNDGLILQYKSRDFIVRTIDLEIDSIATTPLKGDVIIETDSDGTMHYFEATPFNGGPVWEWGDQHRNSIRIHTKFIRKESA